MRMSSKVLGAALIVASAPWLAAPASAGPLSDSLALKNAAPASVETVQYRRHRARPWIGPAAGFAAGVAIGSTFGPRYYDDGYYSYGYAAPAPGYGYVAPAPVYRGYGYGSSIQCFSDSETISAYPSWSYAPCSPR